MSNHNDGVINNKKNKKKVKRIMSVLLIIFGIIVSLNLISLFINQVFFSKELDGILPYGELIEVESIFLPIYKLIVGL